MSASLVGIVTTNPADNDIVELYLSYELCSQTMELQHSPKTLFYLQCNILMTKHQAPKKNTACLS